ncbi:hypothetical protein BDQ17DRAFT_1342313 [Cyathus striatus]|nr:hypothetical protein BDQ17DRAFT_1342313 [Cyathus striatus]
MKMKYTNKRAHQPTTRTEKKKYSGYTNTDILSYITSRITPTLPQRRTRTKIPRSASGSRHFSSTTQVLKKETPKFKEWNTWWIREQSRYTYIHPASIFVVTSFTFSSTSLATARTGDSKSRVGWTWCGGGVRGEGYVNQPDCQCQALELRCT